MRIRFEDLKSQKNIKIYDKETLLTRLTTKAICDLLNEQDEKIKSLETQVAKWKQDYENCSKLEKLISKERQYCLDNWRECRQENQQLEQSQNQKAIEMLESVLCQIKNKLDTTKDKTFAQFDFMTFKPIIDFINNQITKLKRDK